MNGISANKLLYDFRRKLNVSNSSQSDNLRVVDVVSYLNEALEIWFENKVFASETSDKISNDLRVFKVLKNTLPCKKIDRYCCSIVFPKDYYKSLNIVVSVTSECCKGIKKTIVPYKPQSDELQLSRKNKYWKSSFEWEQLLYTETNDGFVFYTDGEMCIDKVNLTYYRKPKYIQLPNAVECGDYTYKDWDNKVIKENINFEVDATFANREVTDIAVLIRERDSKNTEHFNSQIKKILQVNTLYRN